VRQSEECLLYYKMGFYDTQMSIANKVMENIKKKDRGVDK